MKAALLGATGLEIAQADVPQPGPEEVQVRVRAAALNRADLIMLSGRKHGGHGGTGAVLGLEWAGEVSALGSAVNEFKVGDRVMGSGKGAFAQFAVADRGRVLPLPNASLGFRDAACLPVALQTMHDAVATNGQMKPGQSVLILGASTGVGLLGLQIAKLLGASLVVGTSTTQAKRERLAQFGADLALDTNDEGWVSKVLEASVGRGVDVVVDQLTGRLASQTCAATAIGGRIVNVGRLAGMHADFDFDLHALRRIQFIGVTFRTRSVQEVRDVTMRMKADLWDALAAGKLRLPIDSVYPFDEAAAALAHMRSNAHFGKVVVDID